MHNEGSETTNIHHINISFKRHTILTKKTYGKLHLCTGNKGQHSGYRLAQTPSRKWIDVVSDRP